MKICCIGTNAYYMNTISPTTALPVSKSVTTTRKSSAITSSYRGFNSIDQEIEREIAMQWFTTSVKTTFSQRNFLLKKDAI